VQERVVALLSDLSALAAPGSRFCFDFIHTDALEALQQRQAKPRGGAEAPKVPDGLAALAALAADKGRPLRSGLPRNASGERRVSCAELHGTGRGWDCAGKSLVRAAILWARCSAVSL
jgi:hypothetical protein